MAIQLIKRDSLAFLRASEQEIRVIEIDQSESGGTNVKNDISSWHVEIPFNQFCKALTLLKVVRSVEFYRHYDGQYTLIYDFGGN